MLQQANIPLSSDSLDKLIRILDVNKDGEVDFTYVATLTSAFVVSKYVFSKTSCTYIAAAFEHKLLHALVYLW